MEILTYSEAKSLGLKQFFSGKPCKNGNIAPRTLSNSDCLCSSCSEHRAEKARIRRETNSEAIRTRARERYAEDGDAKRASARKHYERNSDSIKEKKRKLYADDPQQWRLNCKLWRKKNPNHERSRLRSVLARERKAAKPPSLTPSESTKRWRLKNPDKHAACRAKRRAWQLQATPKWLTPDDYVAISAHYRESRRLSATTGIKHNVDHIVPLKGKNVCGLHVPWNLKPIPFIDNLRKSNRYES